MRFFLQTLIERISFRERIFIPTGANELEVFERIIKAKPVVDLAGEKGAEPESGSAMFNARVGTWGNTLDAAALEAVVASGIAGSPSHSSGDTVVGAPLF